MTSRPLLPSQPLGETPCAGDNGTIRRRAAAAFSHYRSSTPRSDLAFDDGDLSQSTPSIAQLPLHDVRMQLRKAVRFAREQELRQSASLQNEGESTSNEYTEEELDLMDLHNRLGQEWSVEELEYMCEDDGALLEMMDSLAVSESVGCEIPESFLSSTRSRGPFPKASSFSGMPKPCPVPYSPPVPIPPKHSKRRNSATLAAPRSSSSIVGGRSYETQYSRTQCEAQLWDENWNYKLSLESRESFEASSSQREASSSSLSSGFGHKSKSRTDSEVSTEDTMRDDQSYGGDDVDLDVFDMDDV